MAALLLDKSLKKIEYTFRWTGMNIESSRKTRSENLKYKFVYFFNSFLLNTDVLGAVGWFIDSARNGASFTSLTYAAPCVTYCFLANTKSIFILLSDAYINEILAILRKLELAHINHKKVSRKEEIIKKEVNFLFFVLKTLGFFNWALIIAFPLMSLNFILLEYLSTGKVNLQLPFKVLYSFDAYDIKYWPWVFVRHICETVIVIIEMSGVDYFFFVCVSFIVIQFKLLQYDLQTLFDESDEERTSESVVRGPGFRAKFVGLIKWHQELIHAVELLERIYSKSTLVNFGASSVLICLSGFNVLTINDKPYIVSFASFLFASLLQIFTLCYFGDMLMRSTVDVSDAIFNSKWYLVNTAIRQDLKIIQMRGQKPCKLTAYGYADVNLRAFTKVLSTSWSYFALLRTVYTSPRS